MSSEEEYSSQQHNVGDSHANIDEPVGQTSESPIDLEDHYLSAMIVYKHPLDITMSHKPPPDREVIDVDAYDTYDTDVEELDTVPQAFTKERHIRVKQENSGGSSPPIKIEILDDDFDWTPMGVQNIDLTEPDHEMINNEDESNTVPDPPASILNAELGNSILGSKTKKPLMDFARIREAQIRYAERALRRPVATGASSIFGGCIASSSQPFGTGFSASRPDSIADAAAARRFERHSELYHQKKHLGENTLEDDVMWGKAKKTERDRINRTEEGAAPSRGANISDDEAAESDDGIFVSQNSSSRKRTHAEMIDDSDDDDGDQHQANGDPVEKDVVDILGSEGETNNRMKKKAPSKRKTAKSRARDLDEGRLAGIEDYLDKAKRKERKGAGKTKPRKKGRAGKDPKGKSVKGKTIPLRPGQPGYLLNSASLRSCNVYDEANNNLKAGPAPRVESTRKDKALRDLLVDIPLEDLKQARGEKQSIINSTRVLGKHGLCHLANDGTSNWVLKGMATTLYSYQVQGAAWMKQREIGDVAPYGGILADHMGLGKTLQILACMVANRPEPGDNVKATLIVCTTSIAHQWEQEIKKHTQKDVFPIIMRQRAGNRVSGMSGADLLLQGADVVVTTYDEVRRSYPKFEPPKHIVLPEKKRAWWDENYEHMRGILHQVHWYRVVLDEAQAIKNRDSQTSIACRGLTAKHRWAVSATPIQNNVGELYAFFKLLRVKHTGNYQSFVENFCNPKDPQCEPRLHALLRQFMLRRTYADTVMGRPLVILPRNHQRTVTVELNAVERAIYDIVQRRFVEAINQCGREGNLDKRYRSVLHMLLRLRQMTGHPFMLQDIIEKLFKVEDIEKLLALEISNDTAPNHPSRSMLNVMKTMVRTKTDHGSGSRSASPGVLSDTTPSESNVEDDFSSQTEASDGLIFKFKRYLQQLIQGHNWAEMKARSLCHKCGDVPEVPHVTDCYHLYCYECLRALQQEAAIDGEDHAACCECDHRFKEARSCTGIAELEVEPPAQGMEATGFLNKLAPKRNAEKETMRWINYGGEVLPSTKTAAVVAQIEDWQQDEPDKKIIVFSQFHILMNVLAKLFTQKGWGYVKFNGQMSQAERDKALNDFEKDENCKIMIASLKAGGVGLNLTMASKVICVDLWWNSSVEQQGQQPLLLPSLSPARTYSYSDQAFCRVFRIGQDSETFITRFVARNTVDDKLQQMQEHKAAAVGHAIDDESMLKALSLHELLGLFGQVDVNDQEHPFIIVDDDGEYDNENPPTIL
ncbi:MAG: hypothetical protein Q9213_007961 [Squamulea squamosa]